MSAFLDILYLNFFTYNPILTICFGLIFIDEVYVITCDGRYIQGTLAGYDQLQNLVLKEAQERVYQLPKSDDEDTLEMVPLGLYLIRGDNVAIVSDVREGVFEQQANSNFEGFENAEGIHSVVQAKF